MKKKLMLGALALSATAVFGLTGCGSNDGKGKDQEPAPAVTKYSVTFDADSTKTTDDVVIEYEEGATTIDSSRVPKYPTDPQTGFAGKWQWDWNNYELNNEDITVNAVYGEGTQTSPYLVSTAEQFGLILDEYTAYQYTDYAANGTAVATEAEATTKNVNYKTVTVTYTRPSTDSNVWTKTNIQTNKVYFKLVGDIVLNNVKVQVGSRKVSIAEVDLSERYFSGEIDGNGHNLLGLDGSMFISNEGAMFANVADVTFKNLNVHLGSKLGTLVGTAQAGTNIFNNVKIYNTGSAPVYVGADDNNESVFINFALGNSTSLTFSGCENHANIASSADYSGIFLGGYAIDIARLTFDGCKNFGIIKSVGSIGVLTGNGSYSPVTLDVRNCVNYGTISTKKTSHFLVSHQTGRGLINNYVAQYDADEYIKGVYTDNNATLTGSMSSLNPEYMATLDDAQIKVVNKTLGQNIVSGRYKLILSAMASNASGNNHRSLLTNIVIDKNLTSNSTECDFSNVLYGMIDLNTYNSTKDEGDKVVSTYADGYDKATDTKIWTKLEGYEIKYFFDATESKYIIDFTGYEKTVGATDNPLKLNVSADRVSKAIVVYGTASNDIEFIADFVEMKTDVTSLEGIIDQIGTTIEDDKLTGIHAIFREEPTEIVATYNGEMINLELTEVNDYDGEGSGVTAYQYLVEFDSDIAVSTTEYDANAVKITCKIGGTYYSFDLTTDLELKIYGLV